MRTAPAVEEEAVTSRATHDARLLRALVIVTGAAAVVSIASAAILAVHHNWVPVGDKAIFAIRARDVLSSHAPLLGTWTSASLATGVNVNNPGPLYYDLLGIPTTLFGSAAAGVAVGVAFVNMLCAIGIGLVARRQGGAIAASAAFTMVAILAWSMGSEVLIDPTQPSALILPLLLLMLLGWGVARSDYALLPWFVGVASLILQTYVTYVFIVGLLAVWAVVSLVLRVHAAPDRANAVRRARTAGVVAVIVGAVCWAQPLLQQFVGDGPGNITRLWKAARQPSPTIGFDVGTRLTAEVLTVPPWWFRPSFHEFLEPSRVPNTSLPVAILTIGALLLAFGLLARAMLRRHDDVVGLAAVTAVVAIVAGLITAGRIPLGLFGASSHVYRWLWPLSAFVTFVFVLAIARHLLDRVRPVAVVGGFAVIALVFAVLNIPTSDQGSSASTKSIAVTRDLGRQLKALRGKGPVVVDLRFTPFADPYASAVLAQLQGDGIPFVVNDEGMPYQLGFARRYDGKNARAGLEIRVGEGLLLPPEGGKQIAAHFALSPAEYDEMRTLERSLGVYVADGHLELNERGQRALRAGRIAALPGPHDDIRKFVESAGFANLVHDDYLALDAVRASDIARYVALHQRWTEQSVALYLVPVSQISRAS